MSKLHDLWTLIRHEAADAAKRSQPSGTLVATGYNPKTHAVKGMLVPQMVETGWVPLASMHVGNGYGILVGPQVGSADELNGDVFSVTFESGNPNNPIATLKHFSAVENPPEVKSGEMLLKHKDGGMFFFAEDKSITVSHAGGGSINFDKDGNVTINSNDKAVTVDAGAGGLTYKAASHTFDGDVSVTGNVSASGTVDGGGGVTQNGMALT